MSLVIFFGFAAFIFVVGIIVILATFRGWKKEADLEKAKKTNSLKLKTTETTTET